MREIDAFSAFHPALLLLYYVLVLAAAMCLTHPLCLAVSLLGAVAYAVRLRGGRAMLRTMGWMLPLLLLAAGTNVLFNHEGATILTYFSSGNPLTLEALLYGLSSGVLLMTVLLWFTTFQQVMTTDKFVYLFGRVIPALSLVLSMTLRFVPKFRAQLRAVRQARACMGEPETDGFAAKVRRSVSDFSILVTWSLENAVETADSMRARGYGLPGRTAFSIYHFDSRDRRLLAVLLACGTAVLTGWACGAFDWRYYPTVRGAWSGWTAACAAAELALCLLPAALDWREERTWRS